MSPRLSCRRLLLNQAMYSTTASSSRERLRQTRSAISSVLNESTNDSASALSSASPTEPTEARTRSWSSVWAHASPSTLKVEWIKRHRYRSRDEARLSIFRYIETFYNPRRRHS